MMTRRVFGSALAGAALTARCAAPFIRPDRLAWPSDLSAGAGDSRRYRADAQVLLLGMSLLHRSGVGGGGAVWRETPAEGHLLRFLEFNGFSIPAKAAGFNRLGFIREMTRLAAGAAAESIYFGLMTSSPEESAADARKSMHSNSKEQKYTAIDGRIAPGDIATCTAHFSAPATMASEHQSELIGRAHDALAGAATVPSAIDLPHEGAQSFLQSMAEMLRHPERPETRYVYSGRMYKMSLKWSPDPAATALFRGRNLVPATADVMRVTGKLRAEAGGKESDFRLWVERGAPRPLPLRIEYQPKSYLRLNFEAV